MATIDSFQARFLRNIHGNPPVLIGGIGIPGLVVKEAASQTFGAGAPVRPDGTTGKIEEYTAANAVSFLYGQALEAASGTTDDPVLIRMYTPGDLWVMNYEDGATGGVTALALIGDAVCFNIEATTLHLKGDKTGFVVTKPFGNIVDIFCKEHGYGVADLLGDTNGRVVVELQPGAYWGQSG
mgnify:CR=1 FL=1